MSLHNVESTESKFNGNAFLRLLGYMKPHIGIFILCTLMVLGLTGLELYKTMIVSNAIDAFATNGTYDAIIKMSGMYLAVMLLSFVFEAGETVLLHRMGQKIVYDVRRELYMHIQTLTSRYFDITPVGRLVTRCTNDVEALNEMFAGVLVRLFRNVLKIIGLAVVMISIDRQLALVSFILLPVVCVLTYVFEIIARKIFRLVRTKVSDLNTFLSENISGMRIIRVFGREDRKYEEFLHKNTELYGAHKKLLIFMATFRPLIYVLRMLSFMIVLYYGATHVLNETVTVGVLYLFSDYIKQFFDPIEELSEQLSTLQSSIASAEKIFSVMDEEPLVKEKENAIVPEKVLGKIVFDHVWFAYDNENYVLKDVSFTINPGERVAFVGATGAGKTSILNLIGRYYDIQKGHIYIDDIDIQDLSVDWLRGIIGQMQQDVFIFEGDIYRNIALFDDLSEEEVRKAAEYVNASRFIEKLPNQYHEPVSERGATFSAGERQLLSFARTLAHNPSILVMDEATANIDTETELLIQNALDKLMEGRTTIMVAHRLSTIQHADCIHVMSNGKIRESGTHHELLNMNGLYKKLYDLQISKVDD